MAPGLLGEAQKFLVMIHVSPPASRDQRLAELLAKSGAGNQPDVGGDAPPSKMWLALLEEYRAERDELRRRMEIVPKVRRDAAVQILEFQKAHQSIRQARDSLLAQVNALSKTREDAAGQVHELTQELDDAREKLGMAQEELETAKQTSEDLRAQIRRHEEAALAAASALEEADKSAVEDSSGSRNAQHKELEAQLAAANERIVALEKQVESLGRQHKESNVQLLRKLIATEREHTAALTRAAEAEGRLNGVIKERDAANLEVERLEIVVADTMGRAAQGSMDDAATLIAAQQADIAELTSQLDAARDELRLAWAVKDSIAQGEGTAEPARGREPVSSSLDIAGAEAAAASFRQGIAAAVESLDPGRHLTELGTQFQSFAQQALCSGWLSIRRIAELCGEIAHWLAKKPAKLELMAGPLASALDLVVNIARADDPRLHEDTEGLEVYALDDDVDNCECIAAALDKIALRTHYAARAETALQQLGSRRSKLIILDVNLGGETSGFDIHATIRSMPHHGRTPVLFVTGLASAAQRIAETASQHDAFLAKPYNLNELSLKVLCMVLEARFQG